MLQRCSSDALLWCYMEPLLVTVLVLQENKAEIFTYLELLSLESSKTTAGWMFAQE